MISDTSFSVLNADHLIDTLQPMDRAVSRAWSRMSTSNDVLGHPASTVADDTLGMYSGMI